MVVHKPTGDVMVATSTSFTLPLCVSARQIKKKKKEDDDPLT